MIILLSLEALPFFLSFMTNFAYLSRSRVRLKLPMSFLILSLIKRHKYKTDRSRASWLEIDKLDAISYFNISVNQNSKKSLFISVIS